MSDLREIVSGLMVKVHHIPAALADYHVAGMTQAELEFRIEMYKRMGDNGHEKNHASERPSEM